VSLAALFVGGTIPAAVMAGHRVCSAVPTMDAAAGTAKSYAEIKMMRRGRLCLSHEAEEGRMSDRDNPRDYGYELWESRFAMPDYVYGTEPNEFLVAQAHLLPASGAVLSVADGEGRNGVWLAGRGLDVLAIDWSPAALAKAQALAAQRGVALRTEQADIVHWQWPVAQFDVVAAIFIQFLTPGERHHVFARMRDALKPGGLLLIEGYRPEQLEYKTGGPSQVENLYTRALLEAEFGGLSDLQITEHNSVRSEGTGHVGMSALIDLVARK
jgi:SAM-dependent methyltransferase